LPASTRFLRLPLALLAAAAPVLAAHADDGAATFALGAGMQRMPSWMGADTQRTQWVPYVDIDWPGHGELSTTDGLTIDLIGGQKLHGGLYGDYLWGRTRDELGHRLGGVVPSLSPRIHGGGYLEYQAGKRLSLGTQLSHDTQGAGAYLHLYADYQLPNVWYIEHSLEVQWQAMNGPAMRRFFGLTPAQAQALGTRSWQPGAGGQLAYLEYDAFVPTSLHTGFALSLNYGRLLGQAAASPLVTRFGSHDQFTEGLAFVYHF
jgi:outer membrane scaffolding protein for murein synthesis (MipA/OmpV family)